MALFFETAKWKNKTTGDIVTVINSNLINSLSGCSMYMYRSLKSANDNWYVSYQSEFEREHEPVFYNEGR